MFNHNVSNLAITIVWLMALYFIIINLDALSLPVQSFIEQVDGFIRNSRFFQ